MFPYIYTSGNSVCLSPGYRRDLYPATRPVTNYRRDLYPATDETYTRPVTNYRRYLYQATNETYTRLQTRPIPGYKTRPIYPATNETYTRLQNETYTTEHMQITCYLMWMIFIRHDKLTSRCSGECVVFKSWIKLDNHGNTFLYTKRHRLQHKTSQKL